MRYYPNLTVAYAMVSFLGPIFCLERNEKSGGKNMKQRKTFLAMVCPNKDCDNWYRVGNHFFENCPNCNIPMKKVEKEINIEKRC
jgi:hypothetical protein